MEKILLKLSGELFTSADSAHNKDLIISLVNQIKQLQSHFTIGIVIGGGNFFRGSRQGAQLGMTRAAADNVGMLATIMNGTILSDFLTAANVANSLLSAVHIPSIADPIKQSRIDQACNDGRCLIFAGGTGVPFVSTDTNAVIRALQMGAHQVWKATNVDFLYDADPDKNPHAKPLHQATYQHVQEQQLKVMDQTAIVLAEEHKLRIRIFNVFQASCLLEVAHNNNFGSTIY